MFTVQLAPEGRGTDPFAPGLVTLHVGPMLDPKDQPDEFRAEEEGTD